MDEQKEVINAIQRNTKYLEEKLKWINDDISWKNITNELNNTRLAMKMASINYDKLYSDWKKKKANSDVFKEENRQRKQKREEENAGDENHQEQESNKRSKEIVNKDNVESSTIQPIIDTIEECKPEEEKKLSSEENVFSDKKKKSLIKNNIPNSTSREYRAAKRFHGIKNTFKPNEIIELDDDNDIF
jgi:hypothetical protein